MHRISKFKFIVALGFIVAAGGPDLHAIQFYVENPNGDPALEEWKRASISRMNAQEMQQNIQNQVDLQQAIGDFNQQIAQDRANFWALYPDKPGFDAAHKKFEDDLFAKDIMYLSQPKAMRILTGVGDKGYDNGIPQGAITEFNDWVQAVRDKMFGVNYDQDPSIGDLVQGFGRAPEALIDSQGYYQAYVIQRDWSEFDLAHRNPAGSENPDTYGKMLVMRWEKLSPKDAVQQFALMRDAIGEANLAPALSKVRDEPKNKLGEVPAFEKFGFFAEVGDPYNSPLAPAGKLPSGSLPLHLAIDLASTNDPRAYMIVQFAQDLPVLLTEDKKSSAANGGFGSSYMYDFAYGKKTYDQWVAVLGPDVARAEAMKVMKAPRKLADGGVSINPDPRYQGVPTAEFYNSDVLQTDRKAFARAILAFHGDGLTQAGDVDKQYNQLVSTYGEPAVIAAAQGVYDNPDMGARSLDPTVRDYYDNFMSYVSGKVKPKPAVVREKPQEEDNPVYVAWKKWPIGTKITTVLTIWRQVGTQAQIDQGDYPFREDLTLRTIDDYTEKIFDQPYDVMPQGLRPHYSGDNEINHRQGVEKNPKPPVKSGDEVLRIDGKDIRCHWVWTVDQYGSFHVKWTSDLVPGYEVRELDFSGDPANRSKRIGYSETVVTTFTQPPGTPPAATDNITPSGLLGIVPPGANYTSYAPPALAAIEDAPAPVPAAPPPPPPAPAPVRPPTAVASTSPPLMSEEAVRALDQSPQRDNLIALLKQGPLFSGTCVHKQNQTMPVDAELNWNDQTQLVMGWIHFPEQGAKKKVMGAVVNEQGQSVLILRESGFLERSSGSTAVLGLVYRLALDTSSGGGKFRGSWIYQGYSGQITFAPKAR